jgi:flagellar basal-body rod protein FlgF
MTYGLYLSATGMITAQHNQDVIANNLANTETNGFRRELAVQEQRRVESQVARIAGTQSRVLDGIGGGQFLAPSYFDQQQGTMTSADSNLSTAIFGDGFIGVQDEAGQFRLTRNGALMLDKDGRLLTSAGQQVVGPDKTPVRLDVAGRDHNAFNIAEDGSISLTGQEGTVGKIGLFEPTDPRSVKPVGGNLLAPTDATELRPATGRLKAFMAEGSNVDPAVELTRLIESQRLLEANANLLKTQDSTLGRAVNDIGKIG